MFSIKCMLLATSEYLKYNQISDYLSIYITSYEYEYIVGTKVKL